MSISKKNSFFPAVFVIDDHNHNFLTNFIILFRRDRDKKKYDDKGELHKVCDGKQMFAAFIIYSYISCARAFVTILRPTLVSLYFHTSC